MGQKISREAAAGTAARLGELEAQAAQLKVALAASSSDLWQAIDALEHQIVFIERHAAAVLEAARNQTQPSQQHQQPHPHPQQSATASKATPPPPQHKSMHANGTGHTPSGGSPSRQRRLLLPPHAHSHIPASDKPESRLLHSWLQPVVPSTPSTPHTAHPPQSVGGEAGSGAASGSSSPLLGMVAVAVAANGPPRGKRTLPKDLRLAASDVARHITHAGGSGGTAADAAAVATAATAATAAGPGNAAASADKEPAAATEEAAAPAPAQHIPLLSEADRSTSVESSFINEAVLSAPGPFADGASTPAYQRYRAETNRLLLFSEAVDVTLELPESEEGAGFGFSIATAQSKPGVHPPDRALFISSIKPGGAAQRSGQLQKHDRIVKVNDVDVTHGDQAAAVALIRTSGNRIVLTIAHRLKTKRRRESGAPTDVNTAASSNNNPSSNTKPTPLLTKALSGGGPVDVDDVMT